MTYIEELQDAIRNRYNSAPVYFETVPVKKSFKVRPFGKARLKFSIFLIHRKQTESMRGLMKPIKQTNRKKRTVTVLHVPPVTSPELAVRAAIMKDYREREENH